MNVRLQHGTLLVLVGPSGAGKTSFAAQHFRPSAVLSSDAMRALVADDPNDQGATDDAFEVLHAVLSLRMGRGLTTVVDATSVEAWARARLVAEARRHRRPAVALVLALSLTTCLERNRRRADRSVPEATIRKQHSRMRSSLATLAGEGFAEVVIVETPEQVAATTIEVGEA